MAPLRLGMILCAAAILLLSFGTRQSFGLFLDPMTEALGVSRTTFALAVALQNLLWGLSQPLFGVLADRFGLVRVLVVGAVCYVAGLLIMAGVPSALGLHVGAGLLVGLGTSATSFSLVLAAVTRAAPAPQRGLALGLVSAGGSFGQFAIPLFAQGLISGLGWFGALLVLALAAAVMVPCAFGLAQADRSVVQGADSQTLAQALREAGAHQGYWLLNSGFFVCGFHVAFIATHLPSYLLHLDFGPMIGAWALAVIGLFNIIGTLLFGALGGRYRKKLVLSALYFSRSAVFVLFWAMPSSELSVLAAAAAIGLLWLGTVPLTGGLVGQIFGPRYMATLFSIVMMSHQLGAFFGAWVGGYVFDLTGSYDAAWQIAIVLGLASAALHLPIADRPLREAAEPV